MAERNTLVLNLMLLAAILSGRCWYGTGGEESCKSTMPPGIGLVFGAADMAPCPLVLIHAPVPAAPGASDPDWMQRTEAVWSQ